jgi:hypothetical protein
MSPIQKATGSSDDYDNHNQHDQNPEHTQPASRLAATSTRTPHGSLARWSVNVDDYALSRHLLFRSFDRFDARVESSLG